MAGFTGTDLDGFVKSSNSRRANFVIMRRTFRTLNDCEMQHNAEVGLFTKPSRFAAIIINVGYELASPRKNQKKILKRHVA
jgi:hypothetical protein